MYVEAEIKQSLDVCDSAARSTILLDWTQMALLLFLYACGISVKCVRVAV